MSNEAEIPSRPLGARLLHTTLEVLGSLVMAGGVLAGGTRLMCYNNHSCNDFGGVAFLVIGFIATIFVWAGFMSLLAKVRDQPKARRLVDIGAIVLTIGAWLIYAFL